MEETSHGRHSNAVADAAEEAKKLGADAVLVQSHGSIPIQGLPLLRSPSCSDGFRPRGLTAASIAEQLGCSPATLTRSIARFKTLAGLNSAGGVRFIRPGAGSSNGDKPAAVQSVGNIPEEPALIAR